MNPSVNVKFIWYGHAVILMRIGNITIAIDPMMGSNAAPISPFPVERFSTNTLSLITDWPEIDCLLLTHDHYDHLDMESIILLKSKTKKFIVALGLKRHLLAWGIDEKIITEMDWWESCSIDNTQIAFTPTRHSSGRGLKNRESSLWGGWAIKSSAGNYWFSGDGGYGTHFQEIGKRLGPFDFAFMECGQYNPNWHNIHMYPEESVQAAIEVNCKIIMPVHWAGFTLAQHTWTEPVERFVKACQQNNVKYIVPPLGAVINPHEDIQNIAWWQNQE